MRDRIGRPDRECTPEAACRGGGKSQRHLRSGQVQKGLGDRRVNRQRPPMRGHRLLEAPERLQRAAPRHQPPGRPWDRRQKPFDLHARPLLARSKRGIEAEDRHLLVIWPKREDAVVASHGALVEVKRLQSQRAALPGFGELRIDGQGLEIPRQGFGQAAEPAQDLGEIVAIIGIRRSQHDGAAGEGQGLVEPLLEKPVGIERLHRRMACGLGRDRLSHCESADQEGRPFLHQRRHMSR